MKTFAYISSLVVALSMGFFLGKSYQNKANNIIACDLDESLRKDQQIEFFLKASIDPAHPEILAAYHGADSLKECETKRDQAIAGSKAKLAIWCQKEP